MSLRVHLTFSLLCPLFSHPLWQGAPWPMVACLRDGFIPANLLGLYVESLNVEIEITVLTNLTSFLENKV
jgi:hypothetical protein